MTTDSIICFAKDWFEDPTSNHHVMRHVARSHRVLWLNSISTRAPDLGSGRDVAKIWKKLRSFAQGPRQVDENLWVYTPIVLPFPHSALARRLNRYVLRATVRLLRSKLGIDRFQLWTFLPNVADYVGTFGERLVVYYIVDEWSQFSYIDEAQTLEAERSLCQKANIIFAVNEALADRKREYNPNTFVSTHGVDHELFARALDPSLGVPDDIASLPKPVLGFYGTIQDWVDLDLIAFLAKRHPEWSIVLIGTPHIDVSNVERLTNVHLLGRRKHHELVAYCKGFDVGLIPYVVTERMRYVNPIKLREYLSAGLPVVSTAVPEVRKYGDSCWIADDFQEFEDGISKALSQSGPQARERRSQAMASESWAAKVARILELVKEAAQHPNVSIPA